MITTVLAFIVTLGVLIVIHEYGHYRVAVACGVKVLRFSVGFGRVVWRRQATPDSTEFVVSALPLGGYVRMLDEREGPVAPAQQHLDPARDGHAVVAVFMDDDEYAQGQQKGQQRGQRASPCNWALAQSRAR